MGHKRPEIDSAVDDVVQEALRLGAQGYVLKARAQSDLLSAIDAVLEGKQFVSSGLEFNERADVQVPHRHEILFCSDDAVLLTALLVLLPPP